MRIERLEWDEHNLEHIARHDVEDCEVEEVVWGDPVFRRVRRTDRYQGFGQTEAGRYLMVVIDRLQGDNFYVVTARDMTRTERRRFARRKKSRK